MTSSCHRLFIYSVNKTKEPTAMRLAQLEKKGIPLTPITLPLEFDIEDDDHYLEVLEKQGPRDPEE